MQAKDLSNNLQRDLSPPVREQTQLWNKFRVAKLQRPLNAQARQVCYAKIKALARKCRTMKHEIEVAP